MKIETNHIDIWKVLEIDFSKKMHLHYLDETFIKTLKKGLNDLRSRSSGFECKEQYDFLFVKSLERESYTGFWETVVNCCKTSKCQLNYTWSNATYLDGSLRQSAKKKVGIIKSVILVIYNIRYFFEINERIKNYKESLSAYFRFLILVSEVNSILEIKFKKLVVFADMQRLDNLLVQVCNKKNIETATLQHGLYVDYSDIDNLNKVNYKNVVSKYFLAWGDETKELIEKYNKDCIVVVCGNPLMTGDKYSDEREYVTVILDQVYFREYNQKLLNIIEEYCSKHNLKINIKVHPTDSINVYNIRARNFVINQSVTNSIFAVGHTSTLMFEMMSLGIRVFKLKTDLPANKMNSDVMFSTIEELEEKINSDIDFKELSKFYMKFSGEQSLNNYKDFFNNMK